MTWLKRIKPVSLEQSSDVPYVILEDGIRLCYDNLYCEKADKLQHFIKFSVERSEISRQSTNTFRLKNFPVTIPFEDIRELDSIISEGEIIKSASSIMSEDCQDIFIAKSSHVHQQQEDAFQEFLESLEEYSKNFLLTSNDISPEDRNLEDSMILLPHYNWYKTCVAVADKICEQCDHYYCWTRHVPISSITLYGIPYKETIKITNCLDYLGIPERELIWR